MNRRRIPPQLVAKLRRDPELLSIVASLVKLAIRRQKGRRS